MRLFQSLIALAATAIAGSAAASADSLRAHGPVVNFDAATSLDATRDCLRDNLARWKTLGFANPPPSVTPYHDGYVIDWPASGHIYFVEISPVANGTRVEIYGKKLSPSSKLVTLALACKAAPSAR